MKRRSTFDTVRITGGLLPSGLLERVGSQDASLEAVEPTDYYLAPGERLGEAITRSWNRLSGIWEHFSERLDEDGALTGPTRREWLLPLFQELGFGHLAQAPDFEFGEKSYPISHLWETTPFLLFGVGVDIDRRNPGIAGAATASPHGVMQEFLNRSEEHLWGIVSNGKQLRLLRDNASLTRTAYVEFDLRAMFEGEAYSDFAVLWLACHASRLEGPAGKEVLERWREDAAKRGVRALDALRDGVETAIEALGSAAISHPDNAVLLQRLDDRSLDAQELYRQLLRVVYRFLFLLVSESRGLLLDPNADATAKQRYQEHYSVTRLRDLAEAVRGSRHGDLWQQHNVVAQALVATGEQALALLPLGGFLWSRESTEALDGVTIPNEAILTTIRALTTVRPPGELPQRVDYANLGAEELGSIYESLLEYVPEVNPVAGTFELRGAAGNERKTTGSYYTPTSLINELLNSALDPVLDEAAGAADPEQAILDLNVVDPAAGSGHFLIAAAHRMADRLARVRAGDDEPSPDQLRTALRDVIGHCIYAVDINPMAVELAKVALWMEAMEPGKPLTFLDHHIVCGNSLLGTTPRLLEQGIPDAAFKALTGDDKAVVSMLKKRNRAEGKGGRSKITGEEFIEQKGLVALAFDDTPEDLMQHAAKELAAIDDLTDDSMAAVTEKQRRYANFAKSEDQRRLRLAADVWVAAFVGSKTGETHQITTAVVNAALNDPEALSETLAKRVTELAAEYRFHHWHLAFPHVFSGDTINEQTGSGGGFDVILGNPPWDQIQYNPQEAFATSHPDIAAAPTMAARNRRIEQLAEQDPARYQKHLDDLRRVEATKHFVHASGRFPLTSFGRLNTAPLFAEGGHSCLGPAGLMGLIVPTGIATDSFNQHFFSAVVDRKSLVSLLDFENRKGIFPGVHRSFKFSLLTLAGSGRSTDDAEFCFYVLDPTELLGAERRFKLTREDFALLNPNTRTCPIFRSSRDAEISKAVYRRIPVLANDMAKQGEGWQIEIRLMFMMNTASHLFRTSQDLSTDGWGRSGNVFTRSGETFLPLYEGKLIHQFNHRRATYDGPSIRDVTPGELANPSFAAQPRYWLPAADVGSQMRDSNTEWHLGVRGVARATDERTIIAAALPPVATSNTVPILSGLAPKDRCFLLATMNSIVFDYLARQKVGSTDVRAYTMRQFATLSPRTFGQRCPWSTDQLVGDWLSPYVAELTCTNSELGAVALSLLGEERTYKFSSRRRHMLRCELDAAFFHLYVVDRADVDYIMETFPIVKKRDIAEHGSYRTKELILDAYDRMTKAIETGEPYQTILDPPPADPSLCHTDSRVDRT